MDLSPNIAPKFVVIGLNTDKEMSTLFEVTKKHSLSFFRKVTLFYVYRSDSILIFISHDIGILKS